MLENLLGNRPAFIDGDSTVLYNRCFCEVVARIRTERCRRFVVLARVEVRDVGDGEFV